MLISRLFVSSVLAILLIVSPTTAFSASVDDESDYAPNGIPVGAFYLFPVFEVGYKQNSNIFATENDTINDTILLLMPEFEFLSDWNNHAFNIRGDGAVGMYSDEDNENYNDMSILIDGRVDILEDVALFYEGGFQALHEDRGSPDDVNGEEPTKYDVKSANLTFKRAVSTITLEIGGKVDDYAFKDTPAKNGTSINNTGRNRMESEAWLQLGYVLDEVFEAYIRGKYYGRDYHEDMDTAGFKRISNGYSASLGMKMNFSAASAGEVFVGLRQQAYEDDRFDKVDGFNAGAAWLWAPSEFTKVEFSLLRTIEETTLINSSGYYATGFGVSAERAFRDNIIGKLSYWNATFDYNGIDRKDVVYDIKAGLDYYLNRNFYIGANYSFRNRDSNLEGQDYDRNIPMVFIGVQL